MQIIEEDEPQEEEEANLEILAPETPVHVNQNYANNTDQLQQHQPLLLQTPLSAFYDPLAICHCCGKNANEISVCEMHKYVEQTHYAAETVRERDVRARAFLDGIEAGMRLFSEGGLSRPVGIAGPSSDHNRLTPSSVLQFVTPTPVDMWTTL